MTKTDQIENVSTNADPLLIYVAVNSLCRIAEAQTRILENLTEPKESFLGQLLPFAPLLVDTLKRGHQEMGPAERHVMAQFETAHAKLVHEMEEKRAKARAADAQQKTS
jgi:hypothetical protein